jgi:hypothetical protein
MNTRRQTVPQVSVLECAYELAAAAAAAALQSEFRRILYQQHATTLWENLAEHELHSNSNSNSNRISTSKSTNNSRYNMVSIDMDPGPLRNANTQERTPQTGYVFTPLLALATTD